MPNPYPTTTSSGGSFPYAEVEATAPDGTKVQWKAYITGFGDIEGTEISGRDGSVQGYLESNS